MAGARVNRKTICLRLFGGFTLDRGDMQGDGLAYEKARAMLAYVAVESGMAHSRRSLAAFFWPDHAPTAALANLRLVLLNLRQALDAADLPLLSIDREAVRFDPAALPRVDTALFAKAVARAGNPSGQVTDEMLEELETAAALYRGQFLAGFALPDCPEFEAWLQLRRDTWQRDAVSLLARIADAHLARRNHATALTFATRILDIAPWSEDAQRRVIRLLALNGQPAAALVQYENCRRMLQSELGVQPGAETRQLAEQIRKGRLTQEVAPPTEAAPTEAMTMPTDRRQVTVLYCGLETGREDEDPDDVMTLLYPAHLRCCEVMRQHGGHVVPTYAGGVLAYFGYPKAMEHAARQALQAALALGRDRHPGIVLRVAVHTGMVISGGTQAVPDVVGTTTAATIRLRLLAGDGQVVVSAEARRLAAGFFEFEQIGPHALPGIAQPVEVFRLTGARRVPDGLAAAALTPLAGREEELACLASAWQAAKQGQRRALLIQGEPGIGKSRLLHELKLRLSGPEEVTPCELRCHEEFARSPFHPVVRLLESVLGFGEGEDAATQFTRLVQFVQARDPHAPAETIPLLAAFLSLPVRPPWAEATLPPAAWRDAQLAMLLRLLQGLAAQRPLLLFAEDLQWADPSTLDLLGRLIEADRDFPLLVVMTARPEFLPGWPPDRVPVQHLQGLCREEIESIIHALAPALPAATVRSLAERADGIPLFAEELARLARTGRSDEVPATLRDLLAARLDATGEARYTAQLAATIGRSFSLDLLGRVSPLSPQAVMQALHVLEAAGLVRTDDGVNYQFRHALIYETAYQSQTRSRRMASHLRIAQLLQDGGGRMPGRQPEVIARHLAAGGNHEQAVVYWLKAAGQASQNGATAEAIMHNEAGLALIERLADSPEKLQFQFDLLNGLGLAYLAQEGYASPRAAEAHARALALCEQHAGSPDMFRALWGLWASASSRSGYDLALDLARKLLRMAQEGDDPVHVQQACFALGNTCYWRGEFTEAKALLENAIARHRAIYHARHVADFGEDVRVTAGAYLGWVLDALGQQEAARKSCAEAVALARRARHPFSLAYALTFAALLHCRQRRPEEARLLAEETYRLAENHDFHLWRIGARLAKGWAQAQQGDAAGVEEIRACIEATRAAMSGVTLVVLVSLADALAGLGRFAEVLEVVEEALSTGERLGDRHADAELLCLKGDALMALQPERVSAAVACYDQACAIASIQQLAMIEERARHALAAARRRKVSSVSLRRV